MQSFRHRHLCLLALCAGGLLYAQQGGDAIVVGTVAEAMILSATGFVLGPFVYYGHEKAWEYFADDSLAKTAPVKELELLPAAG